jgi:UDP-N-acetylmuramoylalanine--D-glutamate ligase
LASRDASVVAIGEARRQVRRALEADVAVREAGTMDEAVKSAAALARPGGVVLLAPACASLDMFRDYAARGVAFRNAVAALAASGWSPERDRGREQ